MPGYLQQRCARLLAVVLLTAPFAACALEYAAELNRLQAPAREVWAQQLYQGGIPLEPGATYVLGVTARSALPGAGLLLTTKHDAEPWTLFGLNREITLGTVWNRFEVTFTADGATPAGSRLTFQFADAAPGTLWVSDIRLHKAANGAPVGDNLLRNARFNDGLRHWSMDGVGPSGNFNIGLVALHELEKTLSP